jgi:hypothetical protein
MNAKDRYLMSRAESPVSADEQLAAAASVSRRLRPGLSVPARGPETSRRWPPTLVSHPSSYRWGQAGNNAP